MAWGCRSGEAGEGFSGAMMGFAAPGRASWGFCWMRGYRLVLPSWGRGWGGGTGTKKTCWVWMLLAGTGGKEVSGR